MATKRKPLPYTAAFNIDAAIMEITDTIRVLTPILYGKVLDPVERTERVGQAIHLNYKAILALKEARAARPGESEDENPDKP